MFLLLLCVTAAVANLNFDPGLNVQLAAYWEPSSPHFFESCAASPTGACCNSLGQGAGFYTLSYDAVSSFYPPCKPNTGATITDSSTDFTEIRGQQCPYYFYWATDFARLEADMLGWTVPTRIYLGLQENSNTPCAGLPASVQIPPWDIRYLDIEYRTKVCYPRFRDPNIYAHGQMTHYLSFWDEATQTPMSIRLNVFQHWSSPAGQEPPFYWNLKTYNEKDVPGNPMPDPVDIWNLNGKLWGYNMADPWEDPTSDCSSPIESAPWVTLRIDVHAIFNGLIADGHVAADYLDRARWTGSIVAGIESWGESYVAMDVRNYYLRP